MQFPKQDQLHYDAAVRRYFRRLEAQGTNVDHFKEFLINPATALPNRMAAFCADTGENIGDLLSNGIGRLNTFDSMDQAVRQMNATQSLGIVEGM